MMTTNIDFLLETGHAISTDFEIEMPSDLETTANPSELIKRWLTAAVARKMAIDMEGLFQVLYRLDVDETKAMQALTNQTVEAPAEALASLIIEREIRKVKSRNWYKQRPQYETQFEADFINEAEVELW